MVNRDLAKEITSEVLRHRAEMRRLEREKFDRAGIEAGRVFVEKHLNQFLAQIAEAAGKGRDWVYLDCIAPLPGYGYTTATGQAKTFLGKEMEDRGFTVDYRENGLVVEWKIR